MIEKSLLCNKTKDRCDYAVSSTDLEEVARFFLGEISSESVCKGIAAVEPVSGTPMIQDYEVSYA